MDGLKELSDAVIASPEADEPRLAYAAAVADADPLRAELIDVQLRWDRLRKAQDIGDERGRLAMRAGELTREHGRAWASDVAPLVDAFWFVRGFVEGVRMDAAAFLRTAPDLYRRAPVLHLQLQALPPVARAVLSSPHLGRLRSLDLSRGDLGDEDVAWLAARDLPNLRWLNLNFNRIGRAGLDALCASRTLPRLGYVSLMDNAVPDPLPGLVDDYTTETLLSRELRAQHGPVLWLDYTRFRDWPPERDAMP
ncbi:MAG TPA: hypothetical protein VKS60_13860 [Stellaceae bacterium]|nr:hypothetical protein [Stellaceae bacterium]